MRRRENHYSFFVFFFSGMLLAPGILAAQSTAPLQKPLQHEVAVTLKLIQVYITDKGGKPAMVLGPSDFRVFDNGQAVEITDFEVHTAEEAARPPAAKAEPAPAPAGDSNGQEVLFLFRPRLERPREHR